MGLAAVLALALEGAAPAALAGPPSVEVKVGAAKEFSRIELHGPQPSAIRRDGQVMTLHFARAGAPDMARLHVDPPPYLTSADVRTNGSGVDLVLTLAPGVQAKSGVSDGATWINLTPPPEAPPADAAVRRPPTTRPDPVPAGGVVHVTAQAQGPVTVLQFHWRAPLGAAVFRRGDAVWLVFDAKARLDLPRTAVLKSVRPIAGADYTALRIAAPPSIQAAASADGGTWSVTLGPGVAPPADQLRLDQDLSGPAAITAHLTGATGVYWLSDPSVGDKIAAVTALAPAKGLADAHAYVGATLLSSAQGLGVQAVADDLAVESDGDLVRIGRPGGMALSRPGALERRTTTAPVGLPQPASMPSLVDFAAWSKLGEGGFLARYDGLNTAAGEEAAQGKGAPLTARMALARFLAGSELTYEAIGVLNSLGRSDPALAVDPEWRGLRGAARAMAGRWKDAEADFSSPAVADDPAAALWRGYVAFHQGDMAAARTQFANGRSALPAFTPKWRARLGRASAEAALAGGDLARARAELAATPADGLAPEEASALQLTRARVLEASGARDAALALYDQVAATPYGEVATPALLKSVQLKLGSGKMAPAEAMGVLDSLRFRWRGDAVELEVIRALGQLNLSQGRYREALAALRSAGGRSPDLPAAAALQTDLATAFKTLFLDGQADGMQPIQALALFYDFKELTPIGADGDRMVRRLVRRLVDVDLLGQASELLKYQVDNRLDGIAKAQVASDLATIDLMDRRPEDALDAINGSRTTVLPAALNGQRRLVEARALLDLGRTDHAMEVLGKDTGPEAFELRGLAAWRSHDWPNAGRYSEARLGDRWKSATALTPAEAAILIKAGTAYSLAADDAALTRLRTRYAALTEAVDRPDAIKVALAGLSTNAANEGGLGLVQRTADADAFAGWIGRMKARFRETPAALPASPPKLIKAAAPAKPAPAARKS